ncbi:MAG TPA: hypothetical protein VHH34_02665 [Pseudonocardiaceae bacterium]|nr:hypothetical protein [Pseudonocardiaceae bacterium]
MESAEGSTELSAAESLAVIERQRAQVGRELDVNPAVLYAVWGLAWALGFGALALTAAELVPVPLWVGGVVFAAMLVAAMVITGVHIARATRGIRGVSAEVGAMYGWSWALGFGALAAINSALIGAGLTEDQVALLWPATSLLIVGVLYLAGGALWRDRVQFGLGVWVLLTDAVSVFAGVPGNYVVLAVAGGGGLLVAAAWFATSRGRAAVR